MTAPLTLADFLLLTNDAEPPCEVAGCDEPASWAVRFNYFEHGRSGAWLLVCIAHHDEAVEEWEASAPHMLCDLDWIKL